MLLTVQLLAVKKSPPVTAAAAEDGIRIDDCDIVLVGLAVSWENRDAYYVAFTDTTAKGFCVGRHDIFHNPDCCPV